MHDLIDELTDVLNVQPLMAHIDLERRLFAESDRVQADPNQLRQVFLNLIINAADAISSMGKNNSGRLKIFTELEPASGTTPKDGHSMLKIKFIDNGPGIHAEDLGNIFDPFFTTKDPDRFPCLALW